MKTVITLVFSFFCISIFGQVQSIYNNFEEGFNKYSITYSTNIGNRYVFVKGKATIQDIMVSDGTVQGTAQLDKAVRRRSIYFKNKLYYQKVVSGNYQIHVTDGTITNTTIFLDSVDNHNFIHANETELFFMKDNQLWKTDGTLANTTQVTTNFPTNFKVFLGKIYFTAGGNDFVLEGNNINPSTLGNTLNGFIFNGVQLNGVYYSAKVDDTYGCEFWRTDGTVQGTYLVKDLVPESLPNLQTYSGNPRGITLIDNMIYFASENGIWKSDGTTNGTILVKPIENINHQIYSDLSFYAIKSGEIFTSAIVNGKYVVEIETTNHGNELWVSDGTTDGTFALDIFKGSGYGLERSEQEPFAILDNHLYFAADNGQFGKELWRTDATLQGTKIVKDLTPGIKNSEVLDIRAVGDKLFFINQYDNRKNTALYVMDKDAIISTPAVDYPKLDWNKTIGAATVLSNGDMTNHDLELDEAGNIYVAGQSHYYNPIAFFGDENWIIDRTGDNDITFVAKYDAAGNLLWQNYTKGNYLEEMHLAVDKAQNVIVGGSVAEDTWYDFDIQFYGDNKTITSSTPQTYLVKLNPNGEKVWEVFFNTRKDEVRDIIIDDKNDIYVLLKRTLSKYDANGNLIWTKDLTSTGTKRDGILRLFNGFLYLSASTDKSTQDIGYLDTRFIDIMKYTLDGDLVWAKNASTSGFVALMDFEISPHGFINIIGEYTGNLKTSLYEITASEISHKKRSSYLLRLDEDGREFNLINDTITSLEDIVFTDEQEYYILNKEQTAPLGSGNAYEGFEDFRDFQTDYRLLSVTKYDYLHRPIAKRSFYTTSYDARIQLMVDGKIVLNGSFNEQLDTLPFYSKNDKLNIHLLKFELDQIITPKPIIESDAEISLRVFPNPSNGIVNVQIVESEFKNYSLQIFNVHGQSLDYFEKLHDGEYETYNLRNYEPGVYFFQFKNDSKTFLQKVVILKK